MLQLIAPPNLRAFPEDLTEMHRVRFRVFKGRMDWDVEIDGDMERDKFDALEPVYILQRDPSGAVCGCVRLLPTTGPTMLRDTFPMLLAGNPMPSDPTVWETSRFALDVPETCPKGAGGIAVYTYELFAGIVEFSLSRGIREIVTVTDARLERILRRAYWPLRRIGQSVRIGDTLALAGAVDVSVDVLNRLRSRGGLRGPTLWSPAVPEIRT
jgi:N-acyl-L-homoserine lactone synthetase